MGAGFVNGGGVCAMKRGSSMMAGIIKGDWLRAMVDYQWWLGACDV